MFNDYKIEVLSIMVGKLQILLYKLLSMSSLVMQMLLQNLILLM